jgi:hypothetical protein
MNGKEQNEEDIQRLKRELLETKHRLYLLENSRPIKLTIFAKKFLRNPIKGLLRSGDLKDALHKSVVPKPDLDKVASSRVVPVSINSNNPLLRYPNMKVACLGTVDEVGDVCHAFELGDANWMNLLERGIDLVLVSDEAFAASPNASSWLNTAKEEEIPLVVVKTRDEPLARPLQRAAVVLDRTGEGSDADIPFLDIFRDNPINWQRDPKPAVGYIGKAPSSEGLEAEELTGSFEDQPYAAVVADANDVKGFATVSQLLRISARGIPVVVHGAPDSKLPFEVVSDESSALKLCQELLVDTEKREQLSIRQRRQTILEHSQLQRFEFILEKLGIAQTGPEKISAILSTMRPDNIKQALENFTRQTYPNKELVVILHGDGFDRKQIESDIKKLGIEYKLLEKPKESIFGDNLNEAVEAASGDFVTKMDDDDHYGENHFWDLVAAYRYSRADVVGKWSNWVYIKSKDQTTTWVIENQETFTHHLPGGTLMASREFLRKTQFGRVKSAIDSELYRRIESRGASMYATHRYNYVRVRHGEHTYTASDEEFMSRCSEPTFKGFDENRTTV